jgi:hypothetical protein
MNILDILGNNYSKSLDNANVYSISDTAADLPLNLMGSSNKDIYLISWIIIGSIWIYIYRTDYLALLSGFIIGLLLLQLKHLLYTSQMVNIFPTRTPDPKLIFTYIPNLGNDIKNIKNENDISLNKLGGWQVVLKDKFKMSNVYSYMWSAEKYIENIKNDKIKTIDYSDWLNKDANKVPTNVKTEFNPDFQNIHLGRFYDYRNIIRTIYYVMLTVITYGIYISDAKLTFTNMKNKKLLPWILLVMLVSLITWIVGFYIPGMITIDAIQKSMNFKENLTILVISFAITTVLIV